MRRAVVSLIGTGVLVGGLILLPLPIPLGVVMIPTGLIILATEVPLARRTLDVLQTRTGPFGKGVLAVERRALRLAQRILRTSPGADPERLDTPEHAEHASDQTSGLISGNSSTSRIDR